MPSIDFEARRAWLACEFDRFDAIGTTIRVAEIAGRPAGFVTLDRDRTRIDQLAVDPLRQGLGIASALLDTAKARARTRLDLVVNRDNGPARRLYARRGFREIAEATNPTSGLPTLVLRWTAPVG